MGSATSSKFVRHLPCEKCGSSDANSEYDDGHTHCFSCGNTSGRVKVALKGHSLLEGGEYLQFRGIPAKVAQQFGYAIHEDDDEELQVATYRDASGKALGQKLRGPDKKFSVRGNLEDSLYGIHLWKDGGKRVVITEGEVDALSYAAANPGWPVVSIPNGANGAKKAFKKNLEWLERFEEVVIAFDNDDPGRKAAKECAEVLSPGKAKLAKLKPEYKDFNDALIARDLEAIKQAVWNASTHRPDGILEIDDIWEAITTEKAIETCLYPWDGLNRVTRGLRKGELVTLTAGTGIGKSAICREIAYDLALRQKRNVGLMFLEENAKKTALSILGLQLGKPVHLDPSFNPKDAEGAFDTVFGGNRIRIFDHFGSLDVDNLLSRCRYLAVGCGCDFILLDHLSIVLSGLGIDDERKAVDMAMTKLRMLVEQTGVGLILVSHLRRLHSDDTHETGTLPQLAHLRGSHGIAQLSDMVLALRRNQQSDDEDRNKTEVHVLKNRFSGETGYACTLNFDPVTNRLSESVKEPEDETL